MVMRGINGDFRIRSDFEKKVYLRLKKIYPNSEIEVNRMIQLPDFYLEIDLILKNNGRKYAIECKDICKTQFLHLSKVISKLRQIKKSKLFDAVILITLHKLSVARIKKYEKSGIMVLDYNDLSYIRPVGKKMNDLGLINKVLDKHNLSWRQLKVLLGLRGNFSTSEVTSVPKTWLPRLRELLMEQNTRNLHFTSFLNSLNQKKLFYRFMREALELSQRKFTDLLGVNLWSYESFESGLDDQRYIYTIIDNKLKEIATSLNRDYNQLETISLKKAGNTLKIIEKAKNIPEIIGFNFPSRFSSGQSYEKGAEFILHSFGKGATIFRNVIVADEKVLTKYEVDALLVIGKEKILIEFKKNLKNDGRKITNFILDILERRIILNASQSILVAGSIPTQTDLKRFKRANIIYKQYGPVV